MIPCERCGVKAVEERHKPHLSFSDENGNIRPACYSCMREHWDEAANIFGTPNQAAQSAGEEE